MFDANTCELVSESSIIAEMHRAHVARQRRIKAAAYGGIKGGKQMVAPLPEHKKEFWFEIISDKPLPGGEIKIDDILRSCCIYFDLTRSQIISARRTKPVVYARQIAMYLCKYRTTKSYPEIGRRMGGRDHTTVLHGHRKIEARLPKEWMLAFDVAQVEAML